MSKAYAVPLSFELSASKNLRRYVLLVHVIAALAVLYSGVALGIKLLLLLLLIVSYFHYLSKQSYLRRLTWWQSDEIKFSQISQPLNLQTQKQINFFFDAAVENYVLSSPLFLSKHIVILTLKDQSLRKRFIVIVADMLAVDDFRRLKVRLRIYKPLSDANKANEL